MFPTGDLMSRAQILDHLGISDSSERRRRKNDPSWLPHICLGSKVYYRRSSIEAWLDQREATCRRETLNAIGSNEGTTKARTALGDSAIPNRTSASPPPQVHPSKSVWSGWGGGSQ